MTQKHIETRMNIAAIMDLAKRHIDDPAEMQSSAKLCYDQACVIMRFAWNDQYVSTKGAAERALRSLRYSVGVFDEDYKLAEMIMGRLNQNKGEAA